MKLWIRYGVGIGLGLVLGMFMSPDSVNGTGGIVFLAELALNIGRYTVIPLLFFLIPVSIFTLLEERKLLRVAGKTAGYIGAAAAAGVAIGGLMVIVLSPQRIPIIMAETAAPEIPGLTDILLQVFPANAAEIFGAGGLTCFQLPCWQPCWVSGLHGRTVFPNRCWIFLIQLPG